MDDALTASNIAQKTVKGVTALVSRTFLINVLGILTNLVLTIYLDPASFGIFFLVSSLIVFFNYFSDIGLAASLIQKKTEPTLSEYRNVFTIQQLLVLALIIPAFLLSPFITSFYNLNSEGTYLLYAFLFSFLFSSLKTIPTVMLERNLQFEKLIIPQIIENIVYNAALIAFVVWADLGVTSFTYAVLLRGIVGLIAIYIVKPWPIGFSFGFRESKALMSFGVPFQMNSILALLKDDLLTLYLAKVLSFTQVGYIGFAQKWAFLPLRLVMDNVIKVTFPSYSRLQDNREALAKLVEKSLFLIAMFIFPIVGGIIMLSPFFVEYVPRYSKWEPAIIALSFYALNALVASVSVPLTNFLNAIGKIKITLGIMVVLTILTWVLTLTLVSMFGYNGAAAASFAVAAVALISIYFVKKYITFSFVAQIYKQAGATIAMILCVFVLQGFIDSIISLLLIAGMSVVVYSVVLYVLAKNELHSTVRFIFKSMRKS